MATTYYYSLAVDFSNNIELDQFDYEIGESSITATLNGVDQSGDQISIEFASTLTPDHHTVLDTLVEDHVPSTQFFRDSFVVYPTYQTVDTTTYRVNGNFIFPGKKAVEAVSIKSLGTLTSGSTYHVIVWDLTNDKEIARVVHRL